MSSFLYSSSSFDTFIFLQENKFFAEFQIGRVYVLHLKVVQHVDCSSDFFFKT